MPIRFECPECNKSYSVGDDLAGKKAKCKACGATMPIPAAKVPASPLSDSQEEERPRSSRSRREEDEEQEKRPRSRSRRDEDDEEDRPRSRSRQRDNDDDGRLEDHPRKKSNFVPILVIGSVVVGVILLGVLFISLSFLSSAVKEVKEQEAAEKGKIIGVAGNQKKQFTRDEWEKNFIGKTREEIIAEIGRPQHTHHTTETWVYRDIVLNPATAKYDAGYMQFGPDNKCTLATHKYLP